ncbi:MAG TPA: carbon monoxide dehydrogenase subunit G [Patescibacteria group bacterium]|jgi:carbon monoxide dehydrogenase subunit G|nr:carbon monoxide dehydrogenase subunit G [Patescibacteria group bacterium]
MKIEGTYTFAAPQDLVWRTILDPDILARTLPGVQELEKTGENDYKARMKIRIGPVQGVFNGTVTLSDLNPPESCHLLLDGKGAPGFVKGIGDLTLEQQGDETVMSYQGDAQVGGRLASVGQRLMESSTQALLRQSLESLDAQIAARVRGEDTGEEFAPIEPPSELKFAAGMTLKMLDDMVPTEQRKGILQGIVIVLGLLFAIGTVGNWWTNRLANRVANVIEERNRK